MHPTDEFLRHAAKCEQMAKFARDPESMATWNRMPSRASATLCGCKSEPFKLYRTIARLRQNA